MKKILFLILPVVLVACNGFVKTNENAENIKQLYSEPKNCEFLYTIDSSSSTYYIDDAYAEDGMVNIGGFLINDPGNHVNVEDIKRYGNQDNAEREARTVFTLDNGKNLLDVIDRNGIPRMEWFSGKVDPNNRFQILGPSKEYYESLVYKFRNKLEPYKEEEDAED